MKRNYTKRLLALILAMITICSVTAIAATNVSAAEEEIEYQVKVSLPFGDCYGYCSYIKILGKDSSTRWIFSEDLYATKKGILTFKANDVGEIMGISMKTEKYNSFYPNYANIKTEKQDVTIYCGDWIDHGEVGTFMKTDRVYKLNIVTGDVSKAGTDQNVYVTLYDEDGKKSATVNASEVQNHENAFERKTDARIFIRVPDDFTNLDKMDISLSGGLIGGHGWYLESITATTVNSTSPAQKVYKEINEWHYKGDNFTVEF